MMLGKIEYAPNYGCNDTAARAAVEGCQIATHIADGYSIDTAGNIRPNFPQRDSRLWRIDGYPAHELQGCVRKYSGGLDSLPTDGFIYLGSPYSKQADLDEAARLAEQAAAHLMDRGHVVYAPIPHGHTIARHGLPADWPFWKRQCEPFIDAASALVVLKLDGWRDSVGLTYEIARFHEAGKPIVYVTMEDLANG